MKRIDLREKVHQLVLGICTGSKDVDDLVKFIQNNYRRRQYKLCARYYCNTCNKWHKQFKFCPKK